ncbi:uncharacterized protein LOC133125228 [Conger conger]|uniref:uncharacterized protein LOC133125228 n=1 Tax=Conger conger TaxID=82655 RepID=UPI002A59CDD4|nr:uncharacterized protein LOC133125228 [Conger conger]
MSSVFPAEETPSPDSSPQRTGKQFSHSLSSPQLLAELVKHPALRSPREPSPERSSPLTSPPTSPISPPATPWTPPVTPPQPLSPTPESLSLSSPELLSELKQVRTLRHVNPQRALTTVFSGRGRGNRGSTQVSHSTGQSQSLPSPEAVTDERRQNAGSQRVANGTQR